MADWPAIIQACTSILLFIITVIYVWLTYRLVQNTESQTKATANLQDEQARKRRFIARRSVCLELKLVADFQKPEGQRSLGKALCILPTSSWNQHAGELSDLPQQALDALIRTYSLIVESNGLYYNLMVVAGANDGMSNEALWEDKADAAAKSAIQALSLLDDELCIHRGSAT